MRKAGPTLIPPCTGDGVSRTRSAARERRRCCYAAALYLDASATLFDIREAVTTLEDTARIGRRVFGGANPMTRAIENDLHNLQAALRSRETSCTCVPVQPPPPGSA